VGSLHVEVILLALVLDKFVYGLLLEQVVIVRQCKSRPEDRRLRQEFLDGNPLAFGEYINAGSQADKNRHIAFLPLLLQLQCSVWTSGRWLLLLTCRGQGQFLFGALILWTHSHHLFSKQKFVSAQNLRGTSSSIITSLLSTKTDLSHHGSIKYVGPC
jgi:hypothetical protein